VNLSLKSVYYFTRSSITLSTAFPFLDVAL
jgi:hypothetical protein